LTPRFNNFDHKSPQKRKIPFTPDQLIFHLVIIIAIALLRGTRAVTSAPPIPRLALASNWNSNTLSRECFAKIRRFDHALEAFGAGDLEDVREDSSK
jgi:hypothetical protein